jgi:Ca2+-binding EF-hand superfamily protein
MARSQLQQSVVRQFEETALPGVIQKCFDQMDLNRDGTISFQEWQHWLRLNKESPPLAWIRLLDIDRE